MDGSLHRLITWIESYGENPVTFLPNISHNQRLGKLFFCPITSKDVIGWGKNLTLFSPYHSFRVIGRCKEDRKRTAKQRLEGRGPSRRLASAHQRRGNELHPSPLFCPEAALSVLTPTYTKAYIKVGQYPKSYCTMTDDQNPRLCRGAAGSKVPAALLCF